MRGRIRPGTSASSGWHAAATSLNPCGDPPVPVGGTQTSPTADGGALRSQDVRTTTDATSLDGAILRVDPVTGAGATGNPFAGSPDANQRRVVAYGLRHPFRITMRPGIYTWSHGAKVVPGETCPTGSSSSAGLSFYVDGPCPADFDGALFFSDYSRDCIWVMKRNGGPLPDPASVTTFAAGAANPVDVQIGPDGQLYYADFDGGTIRRVGYAAASQSPVAVATATPTAGPTPLNVSFSGTASSDPDAGDTITYAWDLDGDGAYDDSPRQPPRTPTQRPGRTRRACRSPTATAPPAARR